MYEYYRIFIELIIFGMLENIGHFMSQISIKGLETQVVYELNLYSTLIFKE